MRNLIIYLLLLILSTNLYAQKKLWSIKDCMEYAINNSYRVKIQELNNKNTDVNYLTAVLNTVPSISAGTGVTTSFGRSVSNETNTFINTANLSNSYSISGSMTLFNGFSVINGIKSAKIAQLQGKETHQQIIDDICQRTMQAFFNVIYYTELISFAEKKVETSILNLHFVTIQEELGLKGETDILENEAQLASDEYTLLQYKNQYDYEVLNLKDQMSFPLDEDINIDMTDQWWNILPRYTQNSSDDIFRIALNFLPEMINSQLNIENMKLNLKTAKWQQLPSISLSGGYSTSFSKGIKNAKSSVDPFFDQLRHKAGQSVGASVSIPVFGRLSRRSSIIRTKNNLKIYEYNYENNVRDLEKQIERALKDVESKSTEYIQALKKLSAQERVHEINQKRYEEGLMNFIELQNSSNNLSNAQIQKLSTQFEYHIKKHLLDYYSGVNYIEREF